MVSPRINTKKMKKVMMLAAFAAALVSCQTKEKKEAQAVETTCETTYEGVLPAADCPGATYKLTLQGESCTEKGDFALTITYMDAEKESERTQTTVKGKVETVSKEVNGENKTYYKLANAEAGETFYFLVLNDNTLRLVNDELEESETADLNYDIVRVQ